jgi:hypothetical protein
MSISIYYTAFRDTPLTPEEEEQVAAIGRRFSVDDRIRTYIQTGSGENWESFTVYAKDHLSKAGVIFEGATKLPDNNEEAIWIGVRHWCSALTEIRRSIRNARWRVHVDGHEIAWDEAAQAYDPTA